MIPHDVIEQLYNDIIDRSTNQSKAQELAQDIILEGFDIQLLCTQFLEQILKQSIPDYKKAKISEVIAAAEARLIKGGNEELNLMNMLMNIKKISLE